MVASATEIPSSVNVLVASPGGTASRGKTRVVVSTNASTVERVRSLRTAPESVNARLAIQVGPGNKYFVNAPTFLVSRCQL